MKKLFWVLVFVLGAAFSAVAWAEHEHGSDATVVATEENCSKKDGDCKKHETCPMGEEKKTCRKCGEAEESCPCPILDKIMKKSHFLLDNQEELGLSEEQVDKIKAIKMGAKKTAILQAANMQIFEIDLKTKLGESKVDVEGIDAMIDQGMTAMSKSAKDSVQSYADLKSILTEEQMVKAKEIWKKK